MEERGVDRGEVASPVGPRPGHTAAFPPALNHLIDGEGGRGRDGEMKMEMEVEVEIGLGRSRLR